MVVTNNMVRMPNLVGLVVLSLLFASGAAAAAPMSTSGEMDASSEQTTEIDESYTMDAETEAGGSADGDLETSVDDELPCPPDEMCTPAQDDDGEQHMDGEVRIDGEVYVDVDLLDEVELPEDEPAPSDDEEQDSSDAEEEDEQDEEQQDTSEQEEETEANAESSGYTGGTIDHNASGSAYTNTSAEGEHDEAFEPQPEPQEEDNTSDEQDEQDEEQEDNASQELEHEEQVDVREISGYLEARSQEDLDVAIISEEEIGAEHQAPIDHQIELDDSGSVELGLSSKLKASTQGVTSAYGQVSDNVKKLAGQIKGALSGAGSTETVVESSTEVEAVDRVTGQAGVAGEVTSGVASDAVEQIQMPDVQPPTADVTTESEAHSETQVSSDATGDLGLDL